MPRADLVKVHTQTVLHTSFSKLISCITCLRCMQGLFLDRTDLVHRAATSQNADELQRLLDEDPGLIEAPKSDHPHHRPLHEACEAGSMAAARLLLDRGAIIDSTDTRGMTPLMCACLGGWPEVVSLLLSRGADPTLRTRGRRTALMFVRTARRSAGAGAATTSR